MSAEIERKFLLPKVPEWLEEYPSVEVLQGYLVAREEEEVRLRRAGGDLWLTVKRGSGQVREEAEVPIDEQQFEALWPLTESRRLLKIRHRVPLADGHCAEVDVFGAGRQGLLVAEVEFGSEGESEAFEPPEWFGEDVTGDPRYAGRALAGRIVAASRAYRLKRKEGVAAGVRRIALGRAERAIEELSTAGDGDQADAIHAARKDLKKLRAVLRLVRDDLGGKAYRAENRRYRDAGRRLSRSRDAEVKLQTLDSLREHFGPRVPQQAAGAWRARLERERQEIATGGDGLRGALESARAEVDAGAERIPTWPLKLDSWDLIAPGLLRSYARTRREMKRTRRQPSAENVHEWRKRAKDHWYHLRIVRNAWPELLGETADQAHELTDLLGDHHDLAVLGDDLGGREAVEDRARMMALIAERQDELLERAMELGERLLAEKPERFLDRLETYWRAWRD